MVKPTILTPSSHTTKKEKSVEYMNEIKRIAELQNK